MTIDDRIEKLNIKLPIAKPPVGSYVATKISGKFLFISGQISINENGDQNGAVRIMNIATVFQNSLSTYLTTFKINFRDVHLKSDV